MSRLAPISVSTYTRINHLKQTIEALKKNTLAKESILYIFSDGPKKGDEEAVEKVREYIQTIDGFKTMHIVEQKDNNLRRNLKEAKRVPLAQHGKIIRMEDDIVTAPGYLQFMNDALNFYENDKNIIAISGYNVPANFPKSYKYDYYLSFYYNAWGYATWNDKDLQKALDYDDAYSEVMNDILLYNKIKKVHPKLINGLKLIQDGKLKARDYKIVFHSIKNDLYTIKPIRSFVNNIGHDGSGINCGVNNKFGMAYPLNKDVVSFSRDIKYDFKIDQIFYKYFHPDPSANSKINLPGVHPTTLNFMANDICNSRCKMCRVWERKREKEITPEELSTILKDSLFNNLKYIGVSGGEPTLRKDLPEIFHVIASKKGIKGTGLITNALSAEHTIKQITKCHEICMSYGLKFNIMVSLDGIGNTHDLVRGRKGAFKNALKVISHIRDNTSIDLSIGCTIIKENVWQADEVLDFCKKENVYGKFRIGEFINRLYNENLKSSIRNFDNDEKYQIALFFSKLELSYEKSPSVKATYRNIRKMVFEEKPRESGCPYRSEAVGLDSKGQLLFCSPKSPVLDSCLQKSAADIYNNNKHLRKSILAEDCNNCIHDYHAAPPKKLAIEDKQEKLIQKSMSIRQSLINSSVLQSASPAQLQASKFNKPLIIGWYGTETAGDKAIVSSIIEKLRNSNQRTQISISSLHPFITKRTLQEIGAEDLKIVKTYSQEYIDACRTADIIIMGGGPLMGMEPLGFVLTAFSEACKAGIPCIIEGCGIGPFIKEEHILTVKEIIRLSTQIHVRDKSSLTWVINNTGRTDAVCTGDPANMFVERWKNETFSKITPRENDYFTCFLREITTEYANGMSSNDFHLFRDIFEKELGKMICIISKKTGLKPLLMPMHTFTVGNDDRDFARSFSNTYLAEIDYELGDKVYAPQDILLAMSKSKFNVCMRFHSVLFAEKLGVPFVAIDYTGGGKIKGFLEDKKKSDFMLGRDEIKNKIWEHKIDKILKKNGLQCINVPQPLLRKSARESNIAPDKPIKIVHLCVYDSGGAGIAAYRTHKGLQSIGMDSTMIVFNKKYTDPTVKALSPEHNKLIETPLTPSPLWQQQNKRWKNMLEAYPQRPSDLEIFTDTLSTVKIETIPEIQAADIIHLHWIDGMINWSEAFKSFGDKPIVWTLHDMYTFTGGCHYANGCQKYKQFCGECPQLGSLKEDDLSRENLQQKQAVYSNLNLNIVTLCKWMSECVKESSLFSNFSPKIIPNGFPLDIFKPYPKTEIRKVLNISASAKIVLFGADGITNKRKGFNYLLDALNSYAPEDTGQEIIFMFFGSFPKSINIKSKYPTIPLGNISDENQLAMFYSSADVFVIPSLEDNLPNTVIEAMACGTPVVGFNVGGIPDMIKHKKTGFLVKPKDIHGLTEGINWALSLDSLVISQNCRKHAVESYDLNIQAQAYNNLYNNILSSRSINQRQIVQIEKHPEESKQNHFLVTAIVSTYNSENFIRGCLKGLINQTLYRKGLLEIIVIDSGSQENEQSIVREFQARYAHIFYERTERETLYAAWNRGIKLARGKYITNANTDDRHNEVALEVLAQTLEDHPNIGLAYGDCLITERHNETFENNTAKSCYIFPECSIRQVLTRQFFGPQPMWRKSVHQTVGYFNPKYTVQGDYDFFIRLVMKHGGIHIPTFTSLYCRRPDSVERSNKELNRVEENEVHKNYRSSTTLETIYPLLSYFQYDPIAFGAASSDLANIYLRKKSELPRAIEILTKARLCCPTLPSITNNLAVVMAKTGDISGGISLLKSLPDKFKTGQINLKKLLNLKEPPTLIYEHIPHPVIDTLPKNKIGDLEVPISKANILQKSSRTYEHDKAMKTFALAKENHTLLMPKENKHEPSNCTSKNINILKQQLAKSNWRYKTNLFTNQLAEIKFNEGYCQAEISIIVVAWRMSDDLIKNLKAIQRQSESNLEIILINNGAAKNTFKPVLELCDTYIRLNDNKGPNIGRNIGAVFANAPILLFLDDDALPDEQLIKNHLKTFSDFDIVAARGAIYGKTDSKINTLAKHYYLGNQPFPIYADIEGNTAYRAEIFYAVGGWDEMQFGTEGVDLSRRIKMLEPDMRKQIYSPKAIIYHDYASNQAHLNNKNSRHDTARQRLRYKYPDYDAYLASWKNYRGRDDMLIRKDDTLTTNQAITISICIPTHNREQFIKETLTSALEQVSPECEIVIIDDGSTDSTSQIVREFSSSFIRYIYKENSGAPATRNRAIQEAQGDYILWLDSDDILLSGTIDAYLKAIKAYPDVDVFYGNLKIFGDIQEANRTEYIYEDYYKRNDYLLSRLVDRNRIPNPGALLRKSLFNRIGLYNLEFKRAHDYEFWARAVKIASFKHLGRHTVNWRWHANNMSTLSVSMDHSYESRILLKFLQDYSLEQLFPQFNGGIHNKGMVEILAHLEIAKTFAHWLDRKNAIQYYLKLFNKIDHKLFYQLEADKKKWPLLKKLLEQILKDNPNLLKSHIKEIQRMTQSTTVQEPKQALKFFNGNKLPKVLFICHNFPPYRYGGAQLYALNLAKSLHRQKLAQVEILYPVFRDEFPIHEIVTTTYEGITVHQLRKDFTHGFKQSVRHDGVAKLFNQFLEQNSFDRVHVHGLGQLSGVPIEIANAHGLPITITLHDHWFLCFYYFLMTPDQQRCTGPETADKCAKCFVKNYMKIQEAASNYKVILKETGHYFQYRRNYFMKMLRLANNVFGPSRYLIDIFTQYGFSNIQQLPLGMSSMKVLPAKPHHDIHFGYIGKITRVKGLNILVEAFKQAYPKNAQLHIFGKPYEKDFFDQILEEIVVTPNVQYHGDYEPENLPEIMSQIDVLIVPSLSENYPLVVMEAFQCRIPVVGSNIAGIPELITDKKNGLLFKMGDINDLKDKICRICNDPSLIKSWEENITEIRTISEDTVFYTNIYSGKPVMKTPAPKKNKYVVQFYVQNSVHWPMYENLYNYLKKRPEVDKIIICLPSMTQLLGAQNFDNVENIFKIDAVFTTHPKEIKADITFIASTVQGKVKGCGKVVSIGHGTISKGFFFSDNVWVKRENWVDLLCVPGDYAKDQYQKILSTNVAATGMPKLDTIFSGTYNRKNLCKRLNLNPENKIILYAPTFNIDLSSAYDFVDRIAELSASDRYILIKLHGSTLASTVVAYQSLAANNKNIIFIDDPNIAPYIGGADIMISDVSSAFMEFMALNKPVILYNNPKRSNYHGYNTNDIEWKWRDLGTECDSFDELKYKLPKILGLGDDKGQIRQAYAKQLFADLGGNASQNVWQETLKIINTKSRVDVATISLVLVLTESNIFAVRDQIYTAGIMARLPVELVLVLNGNTSSLQRKINYIKDFHEYINLKIVEAPEKCSNEAAKMLGFNEAEGEIILSIDENAQLFSNFDFALEKSFSHNTQIFGLTGMSTLPDTKSYYPQFTQNPDNITTVDLSYEVINRHKGTEIRPVKLSKIPPLFAFRKETLKNFKNASYTEFTTKLINKNFMLSLSLLYNEIHPDDYNVIKNFWDIYNTLPINERISNTKTILNFNVYPDFAERLWKDLISTGNDFGKTAPYLRQSLLGRFYDLDLKQEVIAAFSDRSELSFLKQEIDIIHQLQDLKSKRLISSNKNSNHRTQPSKHIETSGYPNNSKRVLFYFFKNVHIPILVPIYKKLKQKHPKIEIAFGYMKYAPQIRAGFTQDELKVLKDFGEPLYNKPQDFNPDITFIADSVYSWTQNCGKLVNVGHGVLSKGQYYTDTETARREEQADLVCVPGKYHEHIMEQIVSTPVTATGMAKLDAVFDKSLNRQTVLRQFGLSAGYRYILYAPTFNDELSAIPFVMDRINEVIPDEDTILIIKLHGSTKDEYKTMYRNLVQKDRRVIFADELDITPFLALCDLMISDVSSAMMEFAALDKPLILFNNPNWESYQNYNAEDIEFKWRDIGVQVSSLKEMKKAVIRSLETPKEFSDKRKFYTDQLFANKHDGEAAEKIIETALTLLSDTVKIKGAA